VSDTLIVFIIKYWLFMRLIRGFSEDGKNEPYA